MAETSKLKELVAFLLDIPGLLAFFWEVFGPSIKNGVKNKIDQNPREAVLAVIYLLSSNPTTKREGDILMARLARAAAVAEPDFENEVVLALGHLIPKDKDGKYLYKAAVPIYQWAANLSDRDFAVVVYALKHDPFVQIVRRLIDGGMFDSVKKLFGILFEAVTYGFEEGRKFLRVRLTVLFGTIGMNATEVRARRRRLNAEVKLFRQVRWFQVWKPDFWRLLCG